MTIRIDRRKFLMGSSALVAAGAAGVMPSWAQAAMQVERALTGAAA